MRVGLIVGDVQTGIIETFPWSSRVLDPLVRVIENARGCDVPIIFVRAALRANSAEVPSANPIASWMAGQGELFLESSPQTHIHLTIRPRENETVVVKRRVSAFSGTDLNSILRSQGIESLAISGVATSGVVLASLIDAADLDFNLAVLKDCCADEDETVHDFLMEKVFPGRGARITDSESWIVDACN